MRLLFGSTGARVRTGVLAAVLAIGIGGAGAAPASAAPSSHDAITYAAVGDSYAAGQSRDCTHTATSYPLLLDRLRGIDLVQNTTCAGATTADVGTSQLAALPRDVRLVTVTVGANDLDVAGLVQVCVPDASSPACQTAILTRQAHLPALFASLQATFAAIATTAPRAKIVVTGYAPLVSTGPIYSATQALNDVIRNAALSLARCDVHIRYVDVQFTGHTLDSPDPWFTAAGPDPFHPTAAGELAYARAIAAALHLTHTDR